MSIFAFTFRKNRKVFFFQSKKKKKWKQGYCFGSSEPWLFLIGFYFLIILIENSLKWKKCFTLLPKRQKTRLLFWQQWAISGFWFFCSELFIWKNILKQTNKKKIIRKRIILFYWKQWGTIQQYSNSLLKLLQ